MRVGLVRNVGLSITALAVLALGGCNDNPLSFDVKDTVGIQTNPSEMVVAAGRTADLESRAVNQGNEPTFDAVSAAVDGTCGPGAITVEPDPDALEIQPPGLFVVTGGAVLGQSCITLTSGSNTATVEVTVVTDAIEITAPDDGTAYESGDTGVVTAQLIDLDGNPVGPYAVEDATFTSSDETVIAYTDEVGNFEALASGSSTLTVVWSGQEANGTAGLGVIRQAEITVEVAAGEPVSAAFATPFAPTAAGEEQTVEVIVSDDRGNQNRDPAEILDCSAASSDELVATATCEVVGGEAATDPVNVLVTVVGVGGGSADISSTVEVATGPDILAPAQSVGVVGPALVSLTPATADIGDVVAIDGTGMTFGELPVLVLVDGVALPALYVDDVAETAIGMTMPDLGGAGDYVITVSVGGVESNPLTYTQNADQAPDEPANDAPATATPVTLPADIVGSFSADDVEDFYEFTLAADGDISVTVQWTGVGGFEGKDLDLIVQPAATAIQIDGAQSQYGNDVCGNTGATFPHPPDAETAVCEGLVAGDYVIHLFDWDGAYAGDDRDVSFRITTTP